MARESRRESARSAPDLRGRLDFRLLRWDEQLHACWPQWASGNWCNCRRVCDAPGFSVLDFGVAGPTEPTNAWVCHNTVGPEFHFLAPVDLGLTIPGVVCSFQGHSELVQLGDDYVRGALAVLSYLLSLP